MASTLEELAEHFEAKTGKIKRCLLLRGIDNEAVEILRAINDEVTATEEMLKDYKEYQFSKQRELHKLEALEEFFKVIHDRTEHIAANLPEHLPGRKRYESGKVLKDRGNEEPATGQTKKKPKPKSGVSGTSYHRIDYLTTDEFQEVPKYLKGRLTYQQVNSAIDQIHKVLAAKYKILSSSRAGASEIVMKRYREFRDQETAETKGCYFFIDKDLREYSTFKLDKSGQSILNILRHCGKLKEVRSGKLIRFVVVVP